MFDYFYGAQAEQFAFYRIPKVLFTNDRFRVLSAEAKTLYGILLDRVSLSVKNGWIDQQGQVYIICTIEEIMEDMPTEVVKSRFLKLDAEHIRYALMTLANNTTRVRDMKQYSRLSRHRRCRRTAR